MKAFVALIALMPVCIAAQQTERPMNSMTSPEIKRQIQCAQNTMAIKSIEQHTKGKPTPEQRIEMLERRVTLLELGCNKLHR